MSVLQTLEERLAIVEREVADLKKAVFQETPKPNWLKTVLGSFKDDPEFDEILRLGREMRNRTDMHHGGTSR